MTTVMIHGVPVVHWNPYRRMFIGKLGDYAKLPSRTNNFGDMLTPLVVEGMVRRNSLSIASPKPRRLLAIGSITHFAQDGDVLWGTGVNGKTPQTSYKFASLDVRAVRGPRTRERLAQMGIDAPAIYGDPALLLPALMPQLGQWAAEPVHDVTVVPNLNDYRRLRGGTDVVNPRAPLMEVLERIARSRLVVGSSLHGIVIAESLGIPARLVKPNWEHALKYEDYYLGTGRTGIYSAESVEEAVRDGRGHEPARFDGESLMHSFPSDLWGPTNDA